jgi:TetR/AcrR family transcriptional regulator, mexJK operon transcriptional repressor
MGVRQVSEHIRDYAIADGVPCQDPDAAAEMFITLLRGWYSTMMLRSRATTPAEIKAWTRKTLKLFLASRPSW